MSAEGAPRWGLWLHGERPVPELAALAAHAEARGAAAVFLADELLDRDIYVTLAAVAAATRHLLLVPAITNPYSRHPVTTAVALASLDELAPGRVVTGLGVGGNLVLRPLGLAPERPYTALVETADVVRRLQAGERVTHRGQFQVVDAAVPWARGPLPLAVAGRGPRVEAYATRHADWLLLAGKPIADLPAIAAEARSAPGRAGPAKIAWNPAAAWQPDAVRELRRHFAYMTVDLPAAWRERVGVTDGDVARLRAALAAGGPHAAEPLVPDAVLDAFALVGDRPSVVARLRAAADELAPELVVFGLSRYADEAVDEVAALAADAGLAGHADLVAGAAGVP